MTAPREGGKTTGRHSLRIMIFNVQGYSSRRSGTPPGCDSFHHQVRWSESAETTGNAINLAAPRRGGRAFDVTILYVDLCSRLQIMGSTFFSLHYHLVFSTKKRRPF